MKKIILLFSLLFTILSVHSQTTWKDFTKTADSLDLILEFDTSLPFRAKAMEAAKNQPDSIQKMLLGLQMFTRAENDFNLGPQAYPEAYALMQNAVDTLQSAVTSPHTMSKVNHRLAIVAFDYMYKRQDAEEYLEKAFSYFEKTPEKDTLYLIEMMEFSGYMKTLDRNYYEAIEISEKGLELFEQLEHIKNRDLELKEKLYYNLSLIYNAQFLNIPQKEYQYTIASQKVLKEMNKPDIEAIVFNYRRLALFERDYNNYSKAKGYMHKAIELYDIHKEELRSRSEIGFKLELALYRANVIISMESADEKQMLKNLEKATQIFQNNTLDEVEKGNYKGILNTVVNYYIYVKPDIGTAEKYNNQAKKIQIDSNKAPYSLESFNQKTKIDEIAILFMKEDYQQTIRLITNAERTAEKINDKLLLELKAKSLLAIGETLQANKVINEILAHLSKNNQSFNIAETNVDSFTPGYILTDATGLVDLAKSFRNYYGKYSEEEEKLYWIALAQFENNIGNTPLNKTLKNTFDKITSGLMNAGLERSFSAEENNRLLNFMETVTSQNLINQFLLKREIAGNTRAYKLVEEEQYLRSYITFLKKEYQKSKEESIKQQLFEKEMELEKISEQLTAQYKSSNPFKTPKVDVTSVNDKNIIQFTLANNQLFKIRLYNGSISYQKIDDYPSLKQEIENYLININNLNSGVSKLKKQGEALFHKLFSDDFNTDVPVVIIPDDILHYLPFELLVKNKEYLIENHTISYASNFYFLKSSNTVENNSRNKKVAFFAPEYSGSIPESQLAVRGEAYSLFGAEEEVNELSEFISGNIYLGNSASKTQFKSLDSDISVLHLAMHSNLNDEDPELSNLVFSDSEQDYEMYISELYGLNFNADLAVLSACNTGVGGFKDGGNLVSMHHAFTTAGIPATVASLWNAPDLSTKEIMVSFYKNLQQGQDKATALQNAKLNYLKNVKDENLQHPFYWAGFVLSGDNSPVQLEGKLLWEHYTTILIIVVLLFIAPLYFFLQKRSQKLI